MITDATKAMLMQKTDSVVVILPVVSDKILFQLRDFKKEIVLPGQWGFFGGSINEGETPLEAAFREIKEELCIAPRCMCLLGEDKPLDNVTAYLFSFELKEHLSQFELQEGVDFGLVSLDDIKKKQFYSKKQRSFYPIIALSFVQRTARKALMYKYYRKI